MKKYLLTSIICLCTVIGHAQEQEIVVSTGEELLRALGSNRTIMVAKSIYLTEVFEHTDEWIFGVERMWLEESDLTSHNLPTKEPAVFAERVFDGYGVVIANMEHLTIKGKSADVVIYIAPRYAEVFKFINCEDITIQGLSLGHTDDGDCMGGVLGLYGCNEIYVHDCDLYGCGYTGVTVYESINVNINDSNIRDCTGFIAQIWKARGVTFYNCDIFRNHGNARIEESSFILFTGCRFTQNGPYLIFCDEKIDIDNSEIHLDDSGEEPYDLIDWIHPSDDNRITYDSDDIIPRRREATAPRQTKESASPLSPNEEMVSVIDSKQGDGNVLYTRVIREGQTFWDGEMLYTANEVEQDGIVEFSGCTYNLEWGIADSPLVMVLKKKPQTGHYELINNYVPFHTQPGADVEFIRQEGMNFLAISDCKGNLAEIIVLTPDKVEDCFAQQQFSIEQSIWESASDLLLNTHLLDAKDLGGEGLYKLAAILRQKSTPTVIERYNLKLVDGYILEHYPDFAIITEKMPSTAVLMDRYKEYAVYVNVERPSANEGEIPEIYSVWLTNNRSGEVQKVCVTNPEAKAQWNRMTGPAPDAVEVPLSQIASAEKAYMAPDEDGKVIVEGCPDGRNIWTYIIDVNTNTAKQFPSTEGLMGRDWGEKIIVVGSYGYNDEGRYSFRRVYSIDGKFLRKTDEIEL